MSSTKPPNEVVSSLWFKYHTTRESTLMQDATALQIAMRSLLRDRYWLTDCTPLGPVAIKNIRTRMALRNPRDVITQEEVDELLTPEFGFERATTPDGEIIGWHMPELVQHRGVMLEAREQERAKKRAQRAKQLAPADAPQGPVRASTAGGEDDF
ncbi:hypothetical protein GCM10027399_09020 [Curvibacter fontanus]